MKTSSKKVKERKRIVANKYSKVLEKLSKSWKEEECPIITTINN
jgi:hypothetical protein